MPEIFLLSFIMLKKSKKNCLFVVSLKLCVLYRFPRGPTLTFRVSDYTLSRDVRSSLKRQVTYDKQFINAPLLILNGFQQAAEGERHVSLMTSMFQNMFPSINVTTVHLNSIRRCVLLNYDAETGLVEFRHYTIKVVPVGMSRPVKKILQGKVRLLTIFSQRQKVSITQRETAK